MEWSLHQFTSRGWDSPFPPPEDSATLALVFACPSALKHPEPIQELRAALPNALLLGCSSAGEILNRRAFDDSITVAILRFASTSLRLVRSEVLEPENSRVCGEALGRALEGPGLAAAFLLSDGLRVNGSELALGLSSTLPVGVPVSGGMAGDGPRFEHTWLLASDAGEALHMGPGMVAAVGFYGPDIRVSSGYQGGWIPFGLRRKVTKARGNVLFELDGSPALELYRTYLGDMAAGLPATALRFPLSVQTEEPLEPEVVRTILAIDEKAQSLTFAGDIPEGSIVSLMRTDLGQLIEGARSAARSAQVDPTRPALSIAISCVGRRLLLGECSDEELEATLERMPQDSEQVGFYSYGELAPLGRNGCRLHNETMTLTIIQEA